METDKKKPDRHHGPRNLLSNYNKQHRTQLFSAVMLILVGCGLLVAAFFVPPTGVIHSSVLVAFGEILTFVGALFGIDYHYRARIK